jgi:electron transport complex protein RnfG
MMTISPPDLREPSALRLILTLSLAGFFSGLIIVLAYHATRPAITAYQAEQLRASVFKVLPGVTRIQRQIIREGQLIAAEDPGSEAVYAGYDAGNRLVGYAIPAEGPGFQDTIRLLYGYLPGPRTVVGMEILDSRETPGLGDKIYKDAAFVANFQRLQIDPAILAVKKGRKAAPNEIDAITGATISSKAVVRIINQGNATWAQRLTARAE